MLELSQLGSEKSEGKASYFRHCGVLKSLENSNEVCMAIYNSECFIRNNMGITNPSLKDSLSSSPLLFLRTDIIFPSRGENTLPLPVSRQTPLFFGII